MFRKLKAFVAALSLLSILFTATPATAITVQPIVVNLTPAGRGMTQVVTVTNSFTYPVAVELTIEDLALDPNGVRGTGRDSGDLLIFPPSATIKPGQTQTFRVQYVGDPALARSKHYYVTVAQLPVQLQQGQSAVQVLYNFQVLVSVAPQGGKPTITVQRAEIERSADGKSVPAVTFTNASPTHGYLSSGRLRVVQRDASGRETFRREFTAPEVQQTIGYGLIGAGQTRRVTLPVELPSPNGTVVVQYTPES